MADGEVPQKDPWPIDPARTALINVDLQNVFVEGYKISSPRGPEVLAAMNRLSEACRAAGVMVVHTRAVQRADGLSGGPIADILKPYRGKANYTMTDGDHAAELHPKLVVEPGDVVLDKPRYSAFTHTDLNLILSGKGIDTLIVGGIATNVCVDSTVREGAMLNHKVIVVEDAAACNAVGGYSHDDIHAMTIATLGRYFAEVDTVDGVISRLTA